MAANRWSSPGGFAAGVSCPGWFPLYAFFMAVIPMNRPVQAREIAAAVIFLASDQAPSINGETIAIDAGSLTRGYPALLTGLRKPS